MNCMQKDGLGYTKVFTQMVQGNKMLGKSPKEAFLCGFPGPTFSCPIPFSIQMDRATEANSVFLLMPKYTKNFFQKNHLVA